MTGLDIRIQEIRERIGAASRRRADRGMVSDPVTLVSVTKAFPVEVAQAAIRQGLLDLGESRPQEFRDKVGLLPADVRWHFIGRLQRNKVKYVVGRVALVHSVDRLALAEAISERAVARGCVQDVLLQVNVAQDPAKAGFPVEAVEDALLRMGEWEGVRVRGLMTIPAHGVEPEVSRPAYRVLSDVSRQLRNAEVLDADATQLSMGMSGDFEIAIEEGATLVRVGTGLFGTRPAAAIRE